MNFKREVLISKDNIAIVKNNQKCLKCGYCVSACNEMQVLNHCKSPLELKKLCINCGRCILDCPVDALRERYNYLKIEEILKDKKKIKIVSIAPAVRTAFLEEFGIVGKNSEEKIIGALKKLGFDYVFDIATGADLTIVEESYELESRLKENKNLPMFSSCCPAFVKYIEEFYPELIPNLSTCKSPIAMFGTIIKTYFKEKIKVNAADIVNVVVAPCTAKKAEIKREELNAAGVYTKEKGIHDTDYVLTTRELGILIKRNNIDITKIKNAKFDNPILIGSRAGLLFGNSGGVSESLIRTVYYDLKHENLKEDELVIKELRSAGGIKEYQSQNLELKILAVNDLKNAKDILDKVKNGEYVADFIEVMACPLGCINGGGQPKTTLLNKNKIKKLRRNVIFEEDLKSKHRLCHENPFIQELYANFLDSRGSSKAYQLLHRTYKAKSDLKEK